MNYGNVGKQSEERVQSMGGREREREGQRRPSSRLKIARVTERGEKRDIASTEAV